eukprot:CAMPEP_0113315558 /NCGR_PEP_ID=MMETSP0010_2-20120614/11182_1 /TAXON_ID=216773 ORGANISM="Corethron hystrix, Strain 308" /NCGR_SAMPLE_ID=MMETSP0010_2 /ASSEMBLY_ACC=CAM_ASM_000155 /LENGTH=257 /DNA_ID=CAMNT_0000172091 /DNA_START=60 /DNA_END=833 /DNA_ORIENTATION=+ /assembly_acc=CAM_ASM_000155
MKVQCLLLGCILAIFSKSSRAYVERRLRDYSQQEFGDLEGKAVFIKFFKPGCSRCRKFDPIWQSLEEEFSSDPKIFIGTFDCTGGGGEELHEVCLMQEAGPPYPRLLYGGPDFLLQEYAGARDADALRAFVRERVALPCSLRDEHWCSAEEEELVRDIRAMSREDLDARIEAMNAAVMQEFEEYEGRMEAASAASELAQDEVRVARSNGDADRLRVAREASEKVSQTLQRVEEELAACMEKEKPLELTMMEEYANTM